MQLVTELRLYDNDHDEDEDDDDAEDALEMLMRMITTLKRIFLKRLLTP